MCYVLTLKKLVVPVGLPCRRPETIFFFTQVDLCTDKETDESTKKVKAVSTSEHLFTFGKSKEMKIKEVLRDIWPKEFRKILEKFKH